MKTIYDNKEDGTSVAVEKRPDGSFYGDAGSFDFTAKNEAELIEKLTKWNYDLNPVGFEK